MGEKSVCLQYTRRLEPFPLKARMETDAMPGFAGNVAGDY